MDFNNVFNGMFGKLASGMARLSMNGNIAIKTSGGYKTYNVKTGNLTNCANFVFNGGDDFFWVIPTNKVAIGDIILVNGTPRCVIKNEGNQITAINYENGTVETILPERHVFMGNTYFYGKIASMFGNLGNGKGGMNKIMKYMMLSEMMKGGSTSNSMMPFMLMSGGMGGDMFSDMFGDMTIDDSEDKEEDEEE